MALTLSGRLYDPYGNVLAGASIRFRAVSTSTQILKSYLAEAETDSSGDYSISVRYGLYDISVRQSSGEPWYIIARDIPVTTDSTSNDLNALIVAYEGDLDVTPEVVLEIEAIAATATAAAASASASAQAASDAVDAVTTDASSLPVTSSGSETERTLGDWVDGITYTHKTVGDMSFDSSLAIGSIVKTKEYSSGAGGGNMYEIVAQDAGVSDRGSYIDLTSSGLQAKGLFPDGVHFEQFGYPAEVGSKASAIAYAKSVGKKVSIQSDMTVKVPTDADAVSDVFAHTAVKEGCPASVSVVIESGAVINNAFDIRNADYSAYTLTSEDSVVLADAKNLGDLTLFSTDGAFAVISDAVGPVWDILVDCQNTGPGDIKGITVVGPSSALTINGGKGIKNLGLRDNISGPEPAQYGYGLLVWNGAKARFNNSIISGSAGRNLWISRSATVTGAYGDYSGAQGKSGSDPQDSDNHGAVYCTRASWANLEFSDFSGSAGRGITCTRGYVNAESGSFDNMAGAALVVDRGGRINAYNATGQGGSAIKRSEIGGGVKNFNLLTGQGIVYEGASNPPSVDSYSAESSDGNYILLSSGDLTNYRTRSNPLTLSFNNSSELRGTWTFPQSFVDSDYFLELTLVSETFDSSKRGQWQAKFFSASSTSVDVVLQSGEGWVSGDSATVMVKAVGKAF